MALQLTVTNKEGYDVTYWRVGPFFNIDTSKNRAFFAVRGFKDQAASAGGARHAGERQYSVTENEVTFTDHKPDTPAIYVWLKTLPEWEGAVDV